MSYWISITKCLTSILFIGCSITLAKMEVPKVSGSQFEGYSLERSSPKLKGKNYRAGPYQFKILNGNIWGLNGWSVSSGGNSYEKSSSKFLFEIKKDKNNPLHCRCSISYHEGKLSVAGGTLTEEHGRLECMILDEKESPIANLELYAGNNSEEDNVSGKIEINNATWSISPTFKREGSRLPDFDPTGFLITMDGKILGAVDTMNDGGMYMETTVSEMSKQILASTAFAVIKFSKSTGL